MRVAARTLILALAALALSCAPALADTPSGVTLALSPAHDPLGSQIELSATVAAPLTVGTIDFEYSPADAGTWTSLGMNPQVPGGLPPYNVAVDTTQLDDGLYDFRAVLTELDGQTEASPTLRDQLVDNASPVITLLDQRQSTVGTPFTAGSPVRQTLPMRAVLSANPAQSTISGVEFEISPANEEQWTTLSTVALNATTQDADFDFDTTTTPDGVYDLRAVPVDDQGQSYATIPARGLIIDNTPPAISLNDPGSPLTGTVALTVNASDAGSGVASVEFERAVAGSGAWKRIAMSARTPFTASIDTSGWDNGSYDLRAIATDAAGNSAISNIVTDTSNNPPQPPAAQTSIEGVAVPAHDVTMLGTDTSTGETWAYGFTSAPPATVDGSPLPYTAQGDQFVLLRHTDSSGWQIADVLRNADGSAFQLLPANEAPTDTVYATGAMTPDGEAWLWISESASDGSAHVFGLFHREPGGPFEFDAAATSAVGSQLLSTLQPGLGRLRLSESNGQTFGMLVAPKQAAKASTAPGAGGTPVAISTALTYAMLDTDGTWHDETATLPPSYTAQAGDSVTLDYGDVTGPDAGAGTLSVTNTRGPEPLGLLIGQFGGGTWQYFNTGLDALDLTGSVDQPGAAITPTGLRADGSSAVWIGATLTLPPAPGTPATADPIVARYDLTADRVTNSWCSLPVANSCAEPLDAEDPAAVPNAIFGSGDTSSAVALSNNQLDVFSRGQWSSVPAPGYEASGGAAFTAPDEGWIGSQSAAGEVTAGAAGGALSNWPIADRSPLTSVALPPGSDGGVDEAGALAVGMNGTALLYSPANGWLVAPTPPRASHVALMSVAFDGPTDAFAVGQFGMILRWNGTSWSEDPQSVSLTESQLNAVAFDPSGEGWAVGEDGTILHYDGSSWSIEQPPAAEADTDITSVAIAGSDVLAIAGGNLIERDPATGTWHDADPSMLPSNPAPPSGDMRLVTGLPDGGAVIAGRSLVLIRQSSTSPFQYSDQPLEGIAVALAAFRAADGSVRAAVSLAQPAASAYAPYLPTQDVDGFPAGDGELLIQTADGWQDLSGTEPAGTALDLQPDGQVKPDPVLGVVVSPDGAHAWAVGGYDGSMSASGLGTATILPARAAGWQTASLWRYDAGGSAPPPALASTTPDLPAHSGTVAFAFFSSALCNFECAETEDAQPDTNLKGAITEMNAFAAQPGGPLFAMLGGDAVGPSNPTAWRDGNGAADFAQLPNILAPLQLPLLAAYGPLDAVPTAADPTQPWSDAFSSSPTPFGNGGTAPGITPIASGFPTGVVSRYYAFDATQNGGTLRVIVLDNSKGSLDASDPGQTSWLGQQLAAAAGMPTIVVTARPLTGGGTSDGESIAAQLVSAGVLAVFTTDYGITDGDGQLDEHHNIPDGAAQTIPEYEGATLGYQETRNDGVTWYDVSVDTQQRTVSVNAVPVVQSLALEPLDGLTVARSLTLRFQAIGRRPQGSLATSPKLGGDSVPGYDNYVEIPGSGCATCVTPTYSFTSSNPEVGDFVTAAGAGSAYPSKLEHPVHNSSSGLFCAYNPGTTTVSVTAGLLSYSLQVTVLPGGFGSPCGTVKLTNAGNQGVEAASASAIGGASAPPPPSPATAAASALPALKLPPVPAPAPVAPHPAPAVARPAPAPVAPFSPTLALPLLPASVALVPPPAPPAQPIPPGGAGAPSTSPAKRREKAHKHAKSSAFTTLEPASAEDPAAWWYYGAVGISAVLALFLAGRGMRPQRRVVPARARTRTRTRRR